MARRRKSFNFGALVPSGNAIAIGVMGSACVAMAGAIALMLGSIVHDELTVSLSEEFSTAAENAFEIEFMGNEYQMNSAHTIFARYGGKDYTYDFLTRTVTIDGKNDDFDRLLLFSEMDNPELINNIQGIACTISQNSLTAMQEFRQAHDASLSTEDNTQIIADIEANEQQAQMFITEFCPNIR